MEDKMSAEAEYKETDRLIRQARYVQMAKDEARQQGMQVVVEWLLRCRKIKIPKYQLREWGIEPEAKEAK